MASDHEKWIAALEKSVEVSKEVKHTYHMAQQTDIWVFKLEK